MTDEILFETRGLLGIATLNRPAAHNAQTLAMIDAFAAQLTAWEADPAVTRLLIRGHGGRAFCAGGDVRILWQQAEALQLDFFDREYDLCLRLANTRLETVAYMDGITMGGGVGLSIFARHRLATSQTLWAMPEVRIGFFPDIAAGWFLPRLRPHGMQGVAFGRWLGLTGARLNGADCVAAGIATDHLPAGQGDVLADRLAGDEAVTAVINSLGAPYAVSSIGDTAAALAPLEREELSSFLAGLIAGNLLTEAQLQELCPLSLAVTDELLARGATLTHAATVALDKVLVRHFLKGETFPEGVRARLVDKDNKPRWNQENRPNVLEYFK